MAFELKDGSGSAFKNQKKASASHADYTGSAKIDGKEYWLNTWVKKDKNGNAWFSHSFKPKDTKHENKPVPSKTWQDDGNDFDSDIPF